MKTYDIAVIGGGPAGSMAAIRAGGQGRRVALMEKNDSLGRKIMITGRGRCNLTNTAPVDVFIDKFGFGGEFFRSAFHSFFNEDLMEFFRSRGLELKIERQGRVFPATDSAGSVTLVLERCLKEAGVDIAYGARIIDIKRDAGEFILVSEGAARVRAEKVIIASGGASYKATGSTGDGFDMAARLGHRIAPLSPALVPLKTKEKWVKDLQGLGLENIRITFHCGRKRLVSGVGEAIFTHFGVSGPLVLDLSGDVVSALDKHGQIRMTIDLKIGLKEEQLENKLVTLFGLKGSAQIKSLMQEMLPKRMIAVFLSLLGIAPEKRANQITREERRAIIEALKAFPLNIIGSLPLEEAMVTGGGVSVKDINPRTMESRITPGIYFAGEVIEGRAPSGGYNLQQAFSTGYLAGSHAAK